MERSNQILVSLTTGHFDETVLVVHGEVGQYHRTCQLEGHSVNDNGQR